MTSTRFPIAFASAALAALATCVAAPFARPAIAQEEPAAVAEATIAGDAAAVDSPPAGPVIQELGPADQRVYVVDHGATWSMHAENIVLRTILDAWREAGGPEVTSKIFLDYPYTLSVHAVAAERILERMLEGWSYTLHYAPNGRLERVRVYSPHPTRTYKTPRLTESFGAWQQRETAPEQAATAQPAAPDVAAPATPAEIH